MSQHVYRTTHDGQPISVLLGWDRPIGHYFMVIEWQGPRFTESPWAIAMDDATDNDNLLYSNLDEPNPFELTLAYFKAKLDELGIRVPEPMFEQVEGDRLNRAGNRHVTYQADGSFREA